MEVTSEAIIALGALILSLTTSAVQIYLALRGPIISVRPIEKVILYKDSTSAGAALQLAVRTTMVNSASPEHGDLVEKAILTLKPPNRAPISFPFGSLIKVHLVDDAKSAADKCEVDARCLALSGLVIVDRDVRLIDMPGGQARSDFMSFDLTKSSCTGGLDCEQFINFETASQWFGRNPFAADLTFTFLHARPIVLKCEIPQLNASYLKHIGWLSFSCRSGTVR